MVVYYYLLPWYLLPVYYYYPAAAATCAPAQRGPRALHRGCLQLCGLDGPEEASVVVLPPHPVLPPNLGRTSPSTARTSTSSAAKALEHPSPKEPYLRGPLCVRRVLLP